MRLALVIFVAVTGVAHADEHDDRVTAGDKLFDAGQWRAAREEYLKAYEAKEDPVLLASIASTYFHENDLISARLYYQKFLDAPGDKDPTEERESRERIEQIDIVLARKHTPPPAPQSAPIVVDPYPREIIRRPLTQLPGMFSAAAGIAMATYESADDDGVVARHPRWFGVFGATYGVTERIEFGGEVAVGFDDASRGAAFGQVTARVVAGVAVRGVAGVDFAGEPLARAGVPLRIAIVSRVAIVSTEDAIVLDAEREVFLRLPIGVGLQVARSVYATVGGRIVDAALREGETKFLHYGSAAVAVSPVDAIDAVVEVRGTADRVEVSGFVRMRL